MKTLDKQVTSKTLYSFDIFDTLITRKFATPKGIFLLMQDILENNKDLNPYLYSNFAKIRVGTEDFVRKMFAKQQNYQDITFDEIYERIKTNFNLSEKETEYLKNLEIECEIQNLIPISENITKLKILIERGNNVVLISDMYHSSATLRRILTNIDPIFSDIKIYVSSELRSTKLKNSLYKKIKEELKPKNWIHTGDNKNADYNSAKSVGIKPHLYQYPTLKGYEKEAVETDNLLTQTIVGIAKNLRISSRSKVYDFGASCAGPILYHYVDWIIESSLKSGIKNLYFIARDGYIPKLIADVIIKEHCLNIKTHYIYGSRKAWRVATERTIDSFIYNIFDEYFYKFSTKFLCERFDINKQELETYTNLEYNSKVLSSKERRSLYNRLSNDKNFKAFLINKHKQKVDLIKAYLKQELDFSEEQLAFVDINGSGRTSDMLAELIQRPIQTFFFCTDTNLTQKPQSTKRVFLCSQKFKHFWFELLCRTPDGQTLGYRECNNKIEPVLEAVNPQKLLNWGYEKYIEGILDFSKTFSKIHKNNENKNIDFYYRYFAYIMNKIDKETADILGSIPYCDTGNEINASECAPAYNVLKFIFTRNKDFLFISKPRSTIFARVLINIKMKYNTFRKFIIDVRIHRKKQEVYICILGLRIDLSKILSRLI